MTTERQTTMGLVNALREEVAHQEHRADIATAECARLRERVTELEGVLRAEHRHMVGGGFSVLASDDTRLQDECSVCTLLAPVPPPREEPT